MANGQLKPEKSHNFNLGFYTFLDPKKTLFLDINGFFRNTEDLILLQPIGLRYAQYNNMDIAKVKGIEGSLKWIFLEGYNLNVALTYQDLRRFTPSEQNALYDSRVPYTPYFFGNVSFSKTFSDVFSNQKYFKSDFNFYTNYAYTEQYMLNAVAKINEPALFEEIDGDSSLFIPTQHILDFGITATFKNFPMSLNVEFGNILNQKLYDQFRIQKPSFNWRFKIIYTLK